MIESYIHFADKPKFFPMYNPQTMIKMGIHEGTLIGNQDPNLENNYYGVIEEVPPFHMYPGNSPADGDLIESLGWFKWYQDFYKKKRTELDEVMINWWATVIHWGMQQPRNPAIFQMLLHYSWNPDIKFTAKIEWYGKGKTAT